MSNELDNNHLLNMYYVPGNVLGARNTEIQIVNTEWSLPSKVE